MNESKSSTINVYILSTGLNKPAAIRICFIPHKKKQIRKKFDEPKTPECNWNYIPELEIFWMNEFF